MLEVGTWDLLCSAMQSRSLNFPARAFVTRVLLTGFFAFSLCRMENLSGSVEDTALSQEALELRRLIPWTTVAK